MEHCSILNSVRYPRSVASVCDIGISAISSISEENQMKIAVGIVLASFMLLLGGCNVAPQAPAAQGPAGAAGQTGQTGQQGQSGQTGQTGQTGDQGQSGQTGQTGQTGDQGRTGQTGDTGQKGDQGKAAPCPSGQHRSTSDTGKVVCLPD
jgi:hypothetical protein